jgi:hypothetical protein
MRDFVDENYLFGEIKIWSDSGVRKDSVGILVEAKSDEKLYRKFIVSKAIFFIGNGFKNVEKAIESVNKHKIQGVLGIIDADFKRIEKAIIPKNLFLTDFHDKEMMILNSVAWKSILFQFSDNSISSKTGFSKLQKFEKQVNLSVLEAILKASKSIANIRLLNERNAFGLKFKEEKTKKGKKSFEHIKYEDFINNKTLKVDEEKLQKAVESKSQKLGFFSNLETQKQIEIIKSETYDLMELCNGHDVINIFVFALREAIGSEKNKNSIDRITAEQIETHLTTAYRLEDFQKTDLYTSLLKWESMNLPYALFLF